MSLPSDHLLGFESIFYKDTLFLIGGDSTRQTQYCGLAMHTFKPAHLKFKRHVCEMCRLYFDEEWVGSTREIYTVGTVKEDHDYSYSLKMDNRVLEKFALYIRDEFYAFTLILTCLDLLAVQEVEVNFPKIKPASDQIIDEHDQFQFLKLSCSVVPALIGAILNELIVESQF